MGTLTFIAFWGIVIYILAISYKTVADNKKQIEDMAITEQAEREANPSAFMRDNEQVWLEYMGTRFPLLNSEVPMWKSLSPESKKSWIKQLRDDIKTGKKIPVKDAKGVVVAYKVKDRKTKLKEDLREEIYKKVNNL